MSLFVALALLLTMLAVGLLVWPLLRTSRGPSAPVAATITALLVPATVLLLYLNVSNHGWQQSIAASADAPVAPEFETAVVQLEQRLAAQPEDLDGWLLLGNSYLQLQRFAAAREAFARAVAIDGENPTALLGLAESETLLDRDALRGAAGERVERVLALEPDNPKALWYGGLAAMARGDAGLGETRWRRLLEFSPPEPVRRIINEQLGSTTDAVAPAASSTAPGIDVEISIAAGLEERMRDGAPLFLVARDADRPGPPVAVVRQPVPALPATLRISDADVMLPGRSLADLVRIRLIARVANGGDALAKPGDIFGETLWAAAPPDSGPVAIVMDRVVEP